MDKIAISVPNKWLSEAVQKKLFELGYEWCEEGKRVIENITTLYVPVKNNRYILTDERAWLDTENYTILSVDEFFKREAKKEKEDKRKEWPKVIELKEEGVSIKVVATKKRVILNDAIMFTWQEYDEIGTLRPKES